MDFLSVLKLYPKRTSFFVGAAIGLATYTISSSLCAFQDPCKEYYFFALLIGSATVGLYSGWLVRGFWKVIIIFVSTLLTYFAQANAGLRGVFDPQGDSVWSYILSFGILALIYVVAIEALIKGQDKD